MKRSDFVATGDPDGAVRCTLSYESADTLREVVGELGKHLKMVGKALSVEISQRGQEVTIVGTRANVEKTAICWNSSRPSRKLGTICMQKM